MTVLLGRTTAGATGSFMFAGDAAGWKYVASSSGNCDRLHFQGNVSNASPATTAVELGIYAHNGGSPGDPSTLLGSAINSTAGEIQPGTDFFVTLSPAVAVVSGTTYWLCFDTTGSSGWDYQGDTGVATAYSGTTGGAGNLPSPWVHTDQFNDVAPVFWGEETAAPPVSNAPELLRVVRSNKFSV